MMNIVLWDKFEQVALEYGEVLETKLLQDIVMVKFANKQITPFERKRFLLLDHEVKKK